MANNATSPKPSGSAPSTNASNTSQHKLMAMGDTPKVPQGKKTAA
jgi:hypothetical protein